MESVLKCGAGVLWKVLCAAVFVLREVLCAELMPPRPAILKYDLVPPRPLHKSTVREQYRADVMGLSVFQIGCYANLVRTILYLTSLLLLCVP